MQLYLHGVIKNEPYISSMTILNMITTCSDLGDQNTINRTWPWPDLDIRNHQVAPHLCVHVHQVVPVQEVYLPEINRHKDEWWDREIIIIYVHEQSGSWWQVYVISNVVDYTYDHVPWLPISLIYEHVLLNKLILVVTPNDWLNKFIYIV